MKRTIKYIAVISLLVLGVIMLNSCKKEFLEVTPKGKLIAQKTSDYDLLLNNLVDLNTMDINDHIPMGDDVAAINPYFSNSALTTQRAFRWDDLIFEPDANADEVAVLVKALYTYNIIINEVMDSKDGTEVQKKSIRAEALAGRAWVYFHLINFFGQPYNATTSATDPGFPIFTKADVTETNFTDRGTVKGVYDFIINDLQTAIPDLPPLIHRIRMSKSTAEGFLGKVYMFMGRFNDALPLLNSGITGLEGSQLPTRLYNYNVEFAAGGVFMPINALFGPTPVTIDKNLESAYSRQSVNTWGFVANELVMNRQTVALYKTSDLRRKFFTSSAFPFGAYPAGVLRRFGPSNLINGLLISDLYLLRAEAKARLNDLSGARTDVEKLRENRMPLADKAVPEIAMADRISLTKFIFEERIREFAVTGYRWFDMRRLSVDTDLKSNVGTTHEVLDASGATVDTFNLRPERLTFRIPGKVLNANPGMQDNP